MEITVKNRFIRISPRKVRPILAGLRGENAQKARDRVRFIQKKASPLLDELIKSALAAARESDLLPESLFIKRLVCNEGPRLKRRRFESKGVSRRITKRLSHLELTLWDRK